MSATPLAVEPLKPDVAAALAAAAPFADLPAPVLKAIADASEARRYLAGEAVFALGQFDGGELYFVASGALRAAVADRDTGAMLIDEIPAGAFFGLAEAAAGGDNPRAELTTLTAETDVELVAIDVGAFRGLVAQRPSLTRSLVAHFARALADAGFQSAPAEAAPDRRIFAALMRLVERDAVTGDWRIARMPKHRELAEAAHVDEAAAAGAVARLIQDGVARREYPGLVIDDMTEFGRLST